MAVVVAQLAEQWLPISEVHRSNPVIGKICIKIYYLLTVEKTKLKRKRSRGWPIFKITFGNFKPAANAE